MRDDPSDLEAWRTATEQSDRPWDIGRGPDEPRDSGPAHPSVSTLTDEQVAEWVEASRLAQGLPRFIEEEKLLRDVARLSEPRHPAAC